MRALLACLVLLLAGCTTGNYDEPYEPPPLTVQGYEGPWPDLDAATIRPGTLVGGGCTANFLFRTPDNATLYLGVAAHCFSDPAEGGGVGQAVDVGPVRGAGRLAYNGWVHDFTGANDFALVELSNSLYVRSQVHPAVQHFGGPVGLVDAAQVPVGNQLISYGNSPGRGATDPDNARSGHLYNHEPDGRFMLAFDHPGIPGDSGSGVMTAEGEATGVLVTAFATPLWDHMEQRDAPNLNWATNLADNLATAQAAGFDVELVTWPLLAGPELPVTPPLPLPA